jgi:molecular chaperone GrpE (heat shock protein)
MVEIIRENRGPTFAEKFGTAVGKGLDSGSQLYEAYQKKQRLREENEAFKRMGMDLSGITDPELRKTIISETLKGQNRKKQEDTQKFSTGLETIDRMRAIINKGNVGRGSSILGFFPGETQRDRGELEQLGKSLIPLVAAGVPIRNQKEFEEYKRTITDPSSPDDRFLGALDGLERIFKEKINSEIKPETEEKKGKEPKAKFNPNNSDHQAKANQLYKKFKDIEKVRQELKREFEGVDAY